ncbi:MAG: hypothetical protein CL843_09270 [Crocinitomicaceae bacterium]|nr:hypothetical protein [Crocinitomicaceae bacterium]|tara:strand:+ start:357 stop:749 length:393 start_codon:yes stop_codon:yes gene_type:complete
MNSLTYIYDFDKVRKGKKSVLVRIFFDVYEEKFHSYWVSQKQWEKLCSAWEEKKKSRVGPVSLLAVFDKNRFVWCGLEYPDYSDREFLEENFEAEWVDEFEVVEVKESHFPKALEPENKDPDESLIRGSE